MQLELTLKPRAEQVSAQPKIKPTLLDTVDGLEVYAIPGFENYGVTENGQVWSFPRKCRSKGGSERPVGGRWLKQSKTKGYPLVCLRRDGESFSKTIHRLMGVALLGATSEIEVDHINRRRDDNRIANLRLATKAENRTNNELYRNNTTGLRGVYPAGKRWKALISHSGKLRYIGTYDTPEEAALAYDIEAKARSPRFSVLNIPDADRA